MKGNLNFLFVDQIKERLKRASAISVTQMQFDALLELEPDYKRSEALKTGVIVTDEGKQIKLIRAAKVYYIDGKHKNAV